MRACGGISKARSSSSPSRPRPVGRIELVDAELGAVGVAGDVDEQVAEQAVDEPRRRRRFAGAGSCAEGDLELVEAVVARLVHARRLAGRAEEEAGEEIRERRVVVPVARRRLRSRSGRRRNGLSAGGRAAEDEVVAAARAGVAAVEHELLGGEAGLRAPPRRASWSCSTSSSQLATGCMLHLDDAGIGRDREARQARIARRRIALEQHGDRERGGGRLDGGDQLEIVLERRHAAAGRCRARRRAARRRARCGRSRSPTRTRAGGARDAIGGAGDAPAPQGRVRGRRHRSRGGIGAHGLGAGPRTLQAGSGGHAMRSGRAGSTSGWSCCAHPRQRVERQAIAHRRVAREEVHAARRAGTRDRSASARSVAVGARAARA